MSTFHQKQKLKLILASVFLIILIILSAVLNISNSNTPTIKTSSNHNLQVSRTNNNLTNNINDSVPTQQLPFTKGSWFQDKDISVLKVYRVNYSARSFVITYNKTKNESDIQYISNINNINISKIILTNVNNVPGKLTDVKFYTGFTGRYGYPDKNSSNVDNNLIYVSINNTGPKYDGLYFLDILEHKLVKTNISVNANVTGVVLINFLGLAGSVIISTSNMGMYVDQKSDYPNVFEKDDSAFKGLNDIVAISNPYIDYTEIHVWYSNTALIYGKKDVQSTDKPKVLLFTDGKAESWDVTSQCPDDIIFGQAGYSTDQDHTDWYLGTRNSGIYHLTFSTDDGPVVQREQNWFSGYTDVHIQKIFVNNYKQTMQYDGTVISIAFSAVPLTKSDPENILAIVFDPSTYNDSLEIVAYQDSPIVGVYWKLAILNQGLFIYKTQNKHVYYVFLEMDEYKGPFPTDPIQITNIDTNTKIIGVLRSYVYIHPVTVNNNPNHIYILVEKNNTYSLITGTVYLPKHEGSGEYALSFKTQSLTGYIPDNENIVSFANTGNSTISIITPQMMIISTTTDHYKNLISFSKQAAYSTRSNVPGWDNYRLFSFGLKEFKSGSIYNDVTINLNLKTIFLDTPQNIFGTAIINNKKIDITKDYPLSHKITNQSKNSSYSPSGMGINKVDITFNKSIINAGYNDAPISDLTFYCWEKSNSSGFYVDPSGKPNFESIKFQEEDLEPITFPFSKEAFSKSDDYPIVADNNTGQNASNVPTISFIDNNSWFFKSLDYDTSSYVKGTFSNGTFTPDPSSEKFLSDSQVSYWPNDGNITDFGLYQFHLYDYTSNTPFIFYFAYGEWNQTIPYYLKNDKTWDSIQSLCKQLNITFNDTHLWTKATEATNLSYLQSYQTNLRQYISSIESNLDPSIPIMINRAIINKIGPVNVTDIVTSQGEVPADIKSEILNLIKQDVSNSVKKQLAKYETQSKNLNIDTSYLINSFPYANEISQYGVFLQNYQDDLTAEISKLNNPLYYNSFLSGYSLKNPDAVLNNNPDLKNGYKYLSSLVWTPNIHKPAAALLQDKFNIEAYETDLKSAVIAEFKNEHSGSDPSSKINVLARNLQKEASANAKLNIDPDSITTVTDLLKAKSDLNTYKSDLITQFSKKVNVDLAALTNWINDYTKDYPLAFNSESITAKIITYITKPCSWTMAFDPDQAAKKTIDNNINNDDVISDIKKAYQSQFLAKYNNKTASQLLKEDITNAENSINTHNNSLKSILNYVKNLNLPINYDQLMHNFNNSGKSFKQYLQAKSDEFVKHLAKVAKNKLMKWLIPVAVLAGVIVISIPLGIYIFFFRRHRNKMDKSTNKLKA